MVFSHLKNFLTRFRDDTRGVILVETVITLPLLFWALAATYEFFEVHRYQSIRAKGTYTIADMISREGINPATVDSNYMDNTLRLFDDMVNDDGVNQIRVTEVTYDGPTDTYEAYWSKVRGTGTMIELVDADIATAHDQLPIMTHGTHLILVESQSAYTPTFNVGLGNNISVVARTFTELRILPKLEWDPT